MTVSSLRELYYDPRVGLASKTSFAAKARQLGFATKEVDAFLKAQEVAQLHKERGPRPHYFPVWGRGPGSYQADLMFMDDPRNHAKQIPVLNIIDNNSRMLYGYMLKSKTNAEVLKALMDWVDEVKDKPVFLQTDNGTEFTGRAIELFLAKQGILHGTVDPGDHQGQSMVERVHQTLRRLFTLYEDAFKEPWTRGFKDLVWNYNHRVHSGIGLEPAEADEFVGLARRRVQYAEAQKDFEKFHIGDRVRKLVHKRAFGKGKARWSTQVYIITGTNGHHLFVLDDGTFNKHYELQRIGAVEQANELPSLEPVREAVRRAKKTSRDLRKAGVSQANIATTTRQKKATEQFVAAPAPNPRTLPRDKPHVKNPRAKVTIDPATIKVVEVREGRRLFLGRVGRLLNGKYEVSFNDGSIGEYTPEDIVKFRWRPNQSQKSKLKDDPNWTPI